MQMFRNSFSHNCVAAEMWTENNTMRIWRVGAYDLSGDRMLSRD